MAGNLRCEHPPFFTRKPGRPVPPLYVDLSDVGAPRLECAAEWWTADVAPEVALGSGSTQDVSTRPGQRLHGELENHYFSWVNHGKSTISMAIFNSFLYDYQRVDVFAVQLNLVFNFGAQWMFFQKMG